ncbi:MAG: hypothetical protein P8Y70_00295 [Candidatus Lokiarchaeota archaeon]
MKTLKMDMHELRDTYLRAISNKALVQIFKEISCEPIESINLDEPKEHTLLQKVYCNYPTYVSLYNFCTMILNEIAIRWVSKEIVKPIEQTTTENLEKYIPCKYCYNKTNMLGTQLCDNCYEIETRLKNNPELVIKIHNELCLQNRIKRKIIVTCNECSCVIGTREKTNYCKGCGKFACSECVDTFLNKNELCEKCEQDTQPNRKIKD